MTMRIVLFGASELTLLVAEWLKAHEYDIAAIVTVPRQFEISYTEKKVVNARHQDLSSWGKQNNIPVLFFKSNAELKMTLPAISPDTALVAGWYHLINRDVRALFPLGCYGFHASLLPKLRGGAPLNWAILTRQTQTGVSLFALSEGVDEGDLLGQENFRIHQDDCVGDLIIKSHHAVKSLLKKTMPMLLAGKTVLSPQEGNPSYCGQRQPEDSCIDWSESQDELVRLVRASSHPYAGAYGTIGGIKCSIWRAQPALSVTIIGVPGQIFCIQNHIYVTCNDGAIELLDYECELKLTNQKRFQRCDASLSKGDIYA